MKKSEKYWRSVLPVALGLLGIYRLVSQADSESFYDTMLNIGLGFVGFLAFIEVIYLDIKEFKAGLQLSCFLPTIISVLFIIAIVGTHYIHKQRDKSPVLIEAGYDGGYNGCWFEFREDGSYKFANSGGIGADYFRGTYTIRDSIITLEINNTDGVVQSNRMVIRPMITAENENDSTGKHFLYEVDESGKDIKKQTVFSVHTYYGKHFNSY